ncbi:hypothetical protein MATL_G00065340 [Megalops atlanticus]|uniref:Uncharacterized protein n=1 Tax=Megalops atlanticus TaxID=7932 RepID=A0A9D3QDA8_MEGAT|nr:hypothetical protein MATL_G00065340 [Megalops atlanticus]
MVFQKLLPSGPVCCIREQPEPSFALGENRPRLLRCPSDPSSPGSRTQGVLIDTGAGRFCFVPLALLLRATLKLHRKWRRISRFDEDAESADRADGAPLSVLQTPRGPRSSLIPCDLSILCWIIYQAGRAKA